MECVHVECNKPATWGTSVAGPKWCRFHGRVVADAEPQHRSLCHRHACANWGIYVFATPQTLSVWCAEHAPARPVDPDATSPGECTQYGCTETKTHPDATYCTKHARKLCSSSCCCSAPACTRRGQYASDVGERYCREHRPAGFEAALERHRLCFYPNCKRPRKQFSGAAPANSRSAWCAEHYRASPSPVPYAYPRRQSCSRVGCGTRASYHTAGGQRYCKKHGAPLGAHMIGKSRCAEPNCTTRATSTHDGRNYCKRHGYPLGAITRGSCPCAYPNCAGYVSANKRKTTDMCRFHRAPPQ